MFVQVLTKIKIPLCGWAMVTVQSCYSKVRIYNHNLKANAHSVDTLCHCGAPSV